jgi:hypothetical protein
MPPAFSLVAPFLDHTCLLRAVRPVYGLGSEGKEGAKVKT